MITTVSDTKVKLPKKVLARQHEITAAYLQALDRHLLDVRSGKVTEMMEIRDNARLLHIHPTHLSNTIKLTTGFSACHFFEQKILAIAQTMLQANELPISAIAMQLTYDPSNFTKFFKHFTGQTPRQYREAFLAGRRAENSEAVTINS